MIKSTLNTSNEKFGFCRKWDTRLFCSFSEVNILMKIFLIFALIDSFVLLTFLLPFFFLCLSFFWFYFAVCEHHNDVFIVTEFLAHGDVTALLESENDVPWKLRLSISTQLCQAMIYLHSKVISQTSETFSLFIAMASKLFFFFFFFFCFASLFGKTQTIVNYSSRFETRQHFDWWTRQH